eukprot:SAG22_NODE_1281_length_4896_cov_2.097353_1_plen_180_part_10
MAVAELGGLGGGDPGTLLAACQDLCDPLPGCAGIVTELASFGGSCWAVSSAGVQSPVASGGGRNTSSWLRHSAPAAGNRSDAAAATWWLAPPTLHVFQDALPTAARFCQSVRQPAIELAAARGELESFQLVVHSPTARRVAVRLVQFKRGGGSGGGGGGHGTRGSAPQSGLGLSWRRVGY